MNFLKHYLFFLLVAVFASCQGDSSTKTTTPTVVNDAPDLSQVKDHAKGLCECASPMLQLKTQLEQYKKEGNLEKLQEILEKSSELSEQQSSCQEALEAKFGKFNKADSSHLQILKEICPALAASYAAGAKDKD
jgi:hypothetical protein